jgi:hypothetical protein
MIDRYTKIVLTIIAVSLAGLMVSQMMPKAMAQGSGCGSRQDPCYVFNLN